MNIVKVAVAVIALFVSAAPVGRAERRDLTFPVAFETEKDFRSAESMFERRGYRVTTRAWVEGSDGQAGGAPIQWISDVTVRLDPMSDDFRKVLKTLDDVASRHNGRRHLALRMHFEQGDEALAAAEEVEKRGYTAKTRDWGAKTETRLGETPKPWTCDVYVWLRPRQDEINYVQRYLEGVASRHAGEASKEWMQ